jgi:hypothetical protein
MHVELFARHGYESPRADVEASFRRPSDSVNHPAISHGFGDQFAARGIVMLDNLIFTAKRRRGESAETAGRTEKVCAGSVDKYGMVTLKNSSGVCEKSHNPLTGPPPASYNLLQGKGLPVRLGLPQAAISWPRKRLTGAALSTPSTSWRPSTALGI